MKRSKTKLLIVEQDLALLTQLRWHLDQYEVLSANNRERAIAEVRRHEPALVILDPDLDSGDDAANGFEEGLRCIRELNDLIPTAKIIVISKHTPSNLAMRLLELGVHDLFEKPVVAEILEVVLQRAAYLSELEQKRQQDMLQSASQLPGFISQDPTLIHLTVRGAALAKQRQLCLIEGAPGSGRKRFARAMHRAAFKKKSGAQCLLFDLATQEPALNEHILSQDTQRHTLICYNTHQLSPRAQSKLNALLIEQQNAAVSQRHLWLFLRYEDHEFVSLNDGLRSTLQQERLRLPSLAQREQDVALLARFFLTQYRRINPNVKGMHANAIEAIEAQTWTSVRDLETAVKEGLRICQARLLTAEDLGLANTSTGDLNLRGVRQQAETQAILHSLTAANGNVSKAALLLGVTRPTLYDLIKKYQIKVPTAADIRRHGH